MLESQVRMLQAWSTTTPVSVNEEDNFETFEHTWIHTKTPKWSWYRNLSHCKEVLCCFYSHCQTFYYWKSSNPCGQFAKNSQERIIKESLIVCAVIFIFFKYKKVLGLHYLCSQKLSHLYPWLTLLTPRGLELGLGTTPADSEWQQVADHLLMAVGRKVKLDFFPPYSYNLKITE